MKQLNRLALALASSVFAMSAFAATIDFTSIASGTAITNQYADFTASVSGGQDSNGAPTIAYYTQPGSGTIGGLSNSVNGGYYPTARYLNIDFTNVLSALSFVFDNEGYNGSNAWFAYDVSNTLLESGALIARPEYVTVFNVGSGISRLVLDNGYDNGSWTQALATMTYTAKDAEVPEPTTVALLGLGLLGFAATRCKSAKSKNA